MALANQVAIIGTGTIRFGENFHQSYTDMVASCRSTPLVGSSPAGILWAPPGCG